jgi:hypothetical protein
MHVSDMRDGKWALYQSDEQMREAYEGAIGVMPHGGRGTCACTFKGTEEEVD